MESIEPPIVYLKTLFPLLPQEIRIDVARDVLVLSLHLIDRKIHYLGFAVANSFPVLEQPSEPLQEMLKTVRPTESAQLAHDKDFPGAKQVTVYGKGISPIIGPFSPIPGNLVLIIPVRR